MVIGMTYIEKTLRNLGCAVSVSTFHYLAPVEGGLQVSSQSDKMLHTILLACIVTMVILIPVSVLDSRRKREKVVRLGQMITDGVSEALKATDACIEMCQALAFSEAPLSVGRQAGLPGKALRWTGRSQEHLQKNAKKKALKALKRCRAVAATAVWRTENSRYVVALAVLRNACAACENCPASLGQKNCPAQELLNKMSIS